MTLPRAGPFSRKGPARSRQDPTGSAILEERCGVDTRAVPFAVLTRRTFVPWWGRHRARPPRRISIGESLFVIRYSHPVAQKPPSGPASGKQFLVQRGAVARAKQSRRVLRHDRRDDFPAPTCTCVTTQGVLTGSGSGGSCRDKAQQFGGWGHVGRGRSVHGSPLGQSSDT